MKTISISLSGVADSQADNNEAIDAEIGARVAATESAARKLVADLRAAGVNIQTASAVFAPRPGSHGAARTVDLTVEEAQPEDSSRAEASPAAQGEAGDAGAAPAQ